MKKSKRHIEFIESERQELAKHPLSFGERIEMRGTFFFLFFLFFFSAFGQQGVVKAEIDATNIRIGEQFNLKISVNESQNVIIPKLQLKGLEVIDSTKVDTVKNSLIRKYVLTGFDSGAFYIPQQQIFVRNQAYLTDSLLVNVATVAVDTTKVKKFPIKSIKSEPYTFDDFKIYIYILLVALAIIGFWIYWFVIRKQKMEEEELTYRVLPPYEEAMYKLSELDEKLLWQNNKVKEYYSELTEIVRGYIGRDIEIPTLELTSNEIIDLILIQNDTKKIGLSEQTISNINSLLKNADLVKFAKSKPISHEIETDRKAAEEIIKNIQPKIQEYKTKILTENLIENTTSELSSVSIEHKEVDSKKEHKPIEKQFKEKKKVDRKKIIITAITVTIMITLVNFGSRLANYIGQQFTSVSTEQLLLEKWEVKSFGNPFISIESPVALVKEKKPKLPDEVKNMLISIDNYHYKGFFNNLEIAVVAFEYIPRIKASLEGAVQGAISEIKKQTNVSNFLYNIESYPYENNINGSRVSGTYTENDINKEYSFVVFVQKNRAWIVMTMYKLGDVYGSQIASRVINSIKIETDVE